MTNQKISREVFVDLAKFVEELLGTLRLQYLLKKYERARVLGNKNYVPHRLVHNYKAMIGSLETMLKSPPSGDLVAMMELTLFKAFVDEFRSDPVWPEIHSDLYSTGSFVHMMSLLQFVSMQRAQGCIIELLPNGSGKKTADAVMYTPLKDRIDVEVKAPELLWAPSNLTSEQAKKIIENAWKKSRHQFRSGPSILLIGGIFVPRRLLGLLESAAKEFFHKKKNQHVGYIIINNVSVLVMDPILNNGNFSVGPKTSLSPQIVVHQAKNPYYKGIVEFQEGERDIPGYSKSVDSSEFTINESFENLD